MNTDKIFETIGISANTMVLILFVLVVILLIITIVQIAKLNNLKDRYEDFMEGKDAETLEDTIIQAYRQIDGLVANDQERKEQNLKISSALSNTFQKFGIVKYDAFKEMGGKLSFSIAILNADNTGFILNVMHSREACYTYVKEIIKGESYVALGDEEKEALNKAMYETLD